ncbi:type IV secretory system conjugative DNA transfer family protein [Helicobacter pylori]|uniref:Type IV secretory system conjugative DNA transfer family protein n=1 Tax=Helicobacter pylori TaxID=210 RepID=B3VT74_HELPX|nr:type IV secretory system conjugative DNA transfer family protein [Helicobacter pylori]ACF17792.1 VirD4 [Helicobacter pylori]AFI00487.1 type IV secretion system protein VirD4 [Helicobacter pylori Shi112]QQW93216.1 type IV secretory system conjugative DNA transfer family protein [Helicobacter pylori]QQX50583.1 type IV secretory system conjugative DNA transfer family protein [Helicobacter pylori]
MKMQFVKAFCVLFSILLIPLFFILANYYVFDAIKSFRQAYFFSQSVFIGLYKGASILDLKFEVYITMIMSLMPLVATIYMSIQKTKETSHGYARWANVKDIECFKIFSKEGFCKVVHRLGVQFDKGFILGKFGFPKLRDVCYDKPLGAMIVAPPGAGKTACVALPNLLTLPNSCIITDIKGELRDKTAGYRQKFLNNRILIFNPYGDDNTCYFNPFDKRIVKPMNFDQRLRLVQENANNVFISEEKGEDHWVSKAKDLFSFYALHDVCSKDETNFFDVAMGPNRDYVNLIDKRSRYYKQLYQHDKKTGEIILDPQTNEPILIPNVNARKLWYLQVSEQKYADPKDPRNFDPNEPEPAPRSEGALDEIVRNDARAWANSAEEEFASIISTFNRFVSVFKSNQVRIATSKMSFDYEELRTDNISLYIVIAQKDINTLAPLVRVILESIAKNLLTNESSKKEERIYMILDEFVRFGKLPFLLEMPALCRSYNVVPLFITQDYAMIRKNYSDDDLKILKGVVHYNIVFKMNSAEDAEIVSKEVGEFTRQSKNYSTEKGQLVFGGSSSYSHEGRNLLTAQDIMNIKSDEVIVIVTGAKATPLKLKANYWFRDKELLKRANLPIDLEVERKRFKESVQPTTSQKESENSNLTESEKDNENPTTSQEKNKNENTEQENHNEIDEILKKPLSEISMEEKRALFKKMQQGDEQSEQEKDTQS